MSERQKRGEMDEISIYIHIPFCKRKCSYCAFNSSCAAQGKVDEYINLLCQEIVARKTEKPVKTIYIGGGTPSILSSSQITKIVSTLYENYNIYDNAEFTIEANPNSITEEILTTWKGLRVNRLSIGVQTLDDKALKKIGRLHDKKTALQKIKLARKLFDNVSCDFIIGLENQNAKDLCRYASEILSLGIKHISCYLLEVYDNTELGRMVKGGKYIPLDDEQTIATFNKLSSYLQDKGMERYEISNFAFPSYESKHNLNYWARGEYLGFGLSAHTFVEGKRLENAGTVAEYSTGKKTEENLSKTEEIEDLIMLGLRCKLGVDLSTVETLGYDITHNSFYEDYILQDILRQEGDRLFLNPVFYHLSNTIISNLIP